MQVLSLVSARIAPERRATPERLVQVSWGKRVARRETVAALVAAVAAAAVAGSATSAPSGRFTLKGVAVRVVDGDTLDVRLASGKRERVRLIGIDTPERGDCYAARATAAARRLAQGRPVTLTGDPTQDTRDRYRRLLAYVGLSGGRDLGLQLLRGGFGRVYVYEVPFRRLRAYRRAERVGRNLRQSVWTCGHGGAPAPAARSGRCHPSYRGACLDPNVSDYDCAGGSGNGPKYTGRVRVVGPDVFRLDADGDGYGCD